MTNDTLLTVFFFQKATAGEEGRNVVWKWIGILSLFLCMPLYVSEEISQAYFVESIILRYTIRLISEWGYIYCFKGMPFLTAFYWAILLNTCFNECHNLFMVSLFKDIRHGVLPIVSNKIANGILAALLEGAVFGVIMAVMRASVKTYQIKRNLKMRILSVTVIMILTLYIKSTLRLYENYEMWTGGRVEVVFPVIMVVLILLIIVMLERFWTYQDFKIQYEAQKIAESYRYQNLLDKIQAQEDVRRLYHDMKNHLNSLAFMAKDDEAMEAYIKDLGIKLKSYESIVNSGNDTLDILLTQKWKAAQEQGITMSIYIDFSRGDFMSPLDICTIFGNALDNAIEAAAKVEEDSGKMILIRSQEYANQLIVKIRNSYQGEIRFFKELPVTTKCGDSDYHGLGVGNIVNTVKQYGGIATIDLPEKGVFELKIMLPLLQK